MHNICRAFFGCLIALTIPVASARATGAASAASNWGGAVNAALWDEAAHAAIRGSSALLTATPTDIAEFCPAYPSLGANAREDFWVSLLSRIAAHESGDDPQRVRWRAYDGAAHRPTFRRGLFQISIESAQSRAYQCPVASADELTNPMANIACAAKILDRRVAQANTIASAGRYWTSMRRHTSRREIAAMTASSMVCARD